MTMDIYFVLPGQDSYNYYSYWSNCHVSAFAKHDLI